MPAAVVAGLTTVAQIVHTLLSLSTDSVSTNAAKARALAAASKVGGVLLFVLAIGVALSACALFSKVEPPTATFAVCVASDAAKGDSVSAIAVDCGGDALGVIEALIGSTDPKVTASKAYAEAKVTKASLSLDAGAGAQ